MNDATNCVEQVTSSGGFPWMLLILAAIIAAVVVYKKGLLGTATEARIQKVIAKLREEANQWEDKLKEKLAKKAAPVVVAVPVKDKATRIADNQALLTAGVITPTDFEAAKQKILAE